MNELLEKAVMLVQANSDLGAITLQYDPYHCRWMATADWANKKEVNSVRSTNPEECVKDLISKLEKL